ncbi:MAG: transcription antitermination factor NusB [Planctomycetota bacterium]
MPVRRRAREVALQILFEDDVNPRASAAELESFLHGRLRNRVAEEFARSLILGVRRHRDELDDRISQIATNWSVKRMAGADRNTLRLAAYEALHTETPFAVVVNEAVELAKRFGGPHSGAFVNGVLDRLDPAKQPANADRPTDGAGQP